MDLEALLIEPPLELQLVAEAVTAVPRFREKLLVDVEGREELRTKDELLCQARELSSRAFGAGDSLSQLQGRHLTLLVDESLTSVLGFCCYELARDSLCGTEGPSRILIVKQIAVADHLRGSGRGTRLANWSVSHAVETGCAAVRLTTRSAAAAFYAALGFLPVQNAHMELRLADVTTGGPTGVHASKSAKELLLRLCWQGGASIHDLGARREVSHCLLRDGYLLVNGALRDGADGLAEDAAQLDSSVAAGGQRCPRMLWIDEAAASKRHQAPAVAAAVALLKGLADALNPIVTGYSLERAADGDPQHAGMPAHPATQNAVLTVPPRALVSTYLAGGGGSPPHADTAYDARRGCRVNPRELTAILFANPSDWKAARDGGCLQLWPHSTLERWRDSVLIEPAGGRLLVFFSAFRHQVLPAQRDMRALTLWALRPEADRRG